MTPAREDVQDSIDWFDPVTRVCRLFGWEPAHTRRRLRPQRFGVVIQMPTGSERARLIAKRLQWRAKS